MNMDPKEALQIVVAIVNRAPMLLTERHGVQEAILVFEKLSQAPSEDLQKSSTDVIHNSVNK